MTKANVVLFGVLVAVMAAWVAGSDRGGDSTSDLAPRFFPTFNREYVDAIEISGGWQGTDLVIARRGSDWLVASAGGYPAKAEAAEKFLDAVANLRRDNEVGTSEDLRASTQTGDENGRVVRLYGGGEVIAAFVVGKSPKGGQEEIFVRVESEPTVYRTRTILTEDREKGFELEKSPFGGGGVRGFEWHNYVNNLSTRWIDTDIWDLQGAEVVELRLSRSGDDPIDVKLTKKADDKWVLTETGKEPVPGDADAADGILSPLRSLRLADVVGPYEEARGEYGLETPTRTLVLTLRKEVEDEEKPEDGEGDEKKEKKKKYVTFSRILEVGKKVTRKSYNAYSDKFGEDEYYAIRIGPASDFEDEKEKERARFIFLINSYGVDPLGKKLEDLKQKAEEKDPEDGEGDAEGDAEPKDGEGEGEPKDEGEGEPEKKDDGDAEPTKKDEPEKTDDEPAKKDEPEPKKDDG